MALTFKDALKNRRTYYTITNESPVSEKEIKEILEHALLHVPSAFNSQTTRVVLLLGDQHKKLWEITKDTLRKIVPAENFGATESKIDGAFASGYGTVLFYEDTEVVEGLQKAFPSYSDNFPVWSQQTSGMHQLAVWTMLEEIGFGASLQHYNPLIDAEVAETWGISPKWKLMAEMPFGKPSATPGEKEFQPLEKRLLTFR
ncbi:nitroreductase family protein [Massilibacteroides sp.]|uniref:nitroreductase family protein n=1 Tax=Massilibacteroides sp. TaxID=2034766 RepID=UPI002622325A|nr:nitroreductase family protein [Massilibacteroides sp.]MDD4515758.1 nitroreductase family protein [Massilibacteroides sp.]